MFSGDHKTYTINGERYTLQGSGNAEECEAVIKEYLYQVSSLSHP